jgi:hypothetical protein
MFLLGIFGLSGGGCRKWHRPRPLGCGEGDKTIKPMSR